MHGTHVTLLSAPIAVDHVPAGQGVGAAEPAGQKDPAGHAPQAAALEAPIAAEKVPAAHGVALTEAHGQKKPDGQTTGAPEAQ